MAAPLRELYGHVNVRFFLSSGKTPPDALFLHPQCNTWIELTYNQNQKGILQYARVMGSNGFPKGVWKWGTAIALLSI